MMKPKPFVMEEPGGGHILLITIDHQYHDFIRAMPCVEFVNARPESSSIHVFIDRRYDIDEAWLWIYEQLEAETSKVELSDVWGIEDEQS
jgi:hypothetical protein